MQRFNNSLNSKLGLVHCIVEAMHLNDKTVDVVDTTLMNSEVLSCPSVIRQLNYL